MLKREQITPTIVTDLQTLIDKVGSWEGRVVADVETFGLDPKNGKLLGVALCSVDAPAFPIYVVIQSYDYKMSSWKPNVNDAELLDYLEAKIFNWKLIGHNYTYDKSWLDSELNTDTKWHACTRLMWHMASTPHGPKPYGLKDAQVEVLGWGKRGDDELEAQVEARGGKLKEGGHYLADVEVLGRYACWDSASTALLYNSLSTFFNTHDYWWMLDRMVRYSWLLQTNTEAGIKVNIQRLQEQISILQDTKEAYAARFQELAASQISRLERIWKEDRAAKYSSADARSRFLGSWDMQKKFSLSSDKDKRELFYDIMALPVVVETEGGKPSTSQDAVVAAVRESGRQAELEELLEAYNEYESSETLLNSFARPWAGAVVGERLHPKFNPCGTVSYRLSGFKPYLLNAPFDEKELMSCLQCDEGWEGVHADFSSIEPCVTAHYSQDPGLLKVFRDGRGDVYLDLARTLFPDDAELQQGYNPESQATARVKEHFKAQRKVAKIIQLAVQYTGTKYTVSRNLSAAGIPTSLVEAGALVEAYWKHFAKVKVMNEALFRRYAANGFLLRNVVGRIIRVPFPRYKDLPNRFIQSSAHDLLSMWVLKINDLCIERGVNARPVIIDCHDSTSWQAPKEQVGQLEEIFIDALTWLNAEVKMTVPVKIEMKRFTTLAGLKNKE